MTMMLLLVDGLLVGLVLVQFVQQLCFYAVSLTPGQKVIVDKLAAGKNPMRSRVEVKSR